MQNITQVISLKALAKTFVVIVLLLLPTKVFCMTQPSIDFEKLADAILRAEGNSNYGILKHYKHTSYRQACKNTCQHAYKDWLKYAVRAGKGHKMGYLEFLRDRYAPIGADNDPTGLNKNWLRNVQYFYKEAR